MIELCNKTQSNCRKHSPPQHEKAAGAKAPPPKRFTPVSRRPSPTRSATLLPPRTSHSALLSRGWPHCIQRPNHRAGILRLNCRSRRPQALSQPLCADMPKPCHWRPVDSDLVEVIPGRICARPGDVDDCDHGSIKRPPIRIGRRLGYCSIPFHRGLLVALNRPQSLVPFADWLDQKLPCHARGHGLAAGE